MIEASLGTQLAPASPCYCLLSAGITGGSGVGL